MSNKKIYKNRLSLPIFDNKGIGDGNGVAYIPNVIRGGSAIPIGNNMFLMRGRSHAQGGIDIGKDLEVEGNEVVQNGKFGTKVFSSVPFLRGVSPAERVLRGENPDTVFAAQEVWKRVHKVADDGSKRAALGLSLFKPNSFKVRRVPINDFITPTLGEIEEPETPAYTLTNDEKPVAKAQEYARAAEALKAYPYGNKSSEPASVVDNTLFDDIKGERGFNKSEMRTIYKYLNDNGSNLSDYAKSAILATIAFESGANIRARNPKSTAKGYFQWLDDRYKFADNLSDEEERKLQLQKIINDMNPTDAFVNKTKDARGWTSVGGRGYLKTAEDFRKAQDTLTAVDLITRGHIRPGNQNWEVVHRKMLADMFYNAIAKSKSRKAFGGEDKVYTAPKWAQNSYKKYGKVVIGGTPVINPYLQGSAFALMRNPLLRTLTRDAKNLYSTLGAGIRRAFITSANGIAKLVPNKYLGSYDKLMDNIYSTFIGDAGKDILKETRKGWKYYPNLERLPATINNTVDTVNNIVNEKQFGGMKLNIFKLGGLSRSKDYGSKDKPYPSVNKNDFAGGGRSYPIPTRADAVDALRLAGLHHRSDVRAKVYAKYPDLRKKAKLGKYAKITGSPTNEKIVEPVRTNYVERNNSSDNLGVGIGTILGGGAALSGLGYAGNKLYDKVLEYNTPAAKKAREYSKFLEKRAADKRAVAKAIADRQKTLNTTYGDKISKELNKSIKKGFVVSPNKPSLNEKRITEFPNSKSTRFEYYDERANAALQNRKTAAFNSIKRARFLNPLYRIAPVAAAIDFVKNLFPSKQQEQEEDKAWRRYKSPTGRIPEDYQMKFGGRKKAPYGDYITIGGRRVPLVFDTDNKRHDISDVWHYLKTNANPGNLVVNQYEEHPLFRGFYHSENRPMFSTNPMVSRWYNYGWSHNAGAEVPNYADILKNINPPKPVVTNTSRGRNTNSRISSATQRILDNAEIAPYKSFRTPSLAEVASRYPISERVNIGTSTAPISSSTGVRLNPADVEAVRSGNFAGIDNDRYLPIRTTTEDWVGLGANLLGSIGSYLGTRAMLNRYPMPNKPIPAIAQKLKTRININPQLDTIREQVGRLNTSIDNNTSNSRVAQARKQGVMNNAVASRNQLYGQKENAETQLINQDIMNRQRIGLYSNQIYNDYLNRLGSTRQYLANARIGNFNNVISGANQSIQDLLGRIEDRDAERRNFIFMQAAYPNVNWRNIFQGSPELARSLGFRFV